MANIVARVQALLTQPAQAWPVIAAEPADTKGLILGYAALLSLIPVVVGFLLIGVLGGMTMMRFGIGGILVHMVLQYIIGLAAIWGVGKIIQLLSPMFGGSDDEVSAMKLAVYSPTASWVASVFTLIPFVGFIVALVGLGYSIYLFYLGAPVVAKVPASQAVPFTVAVAVAAIALFFVVGWVIARVVPWF